MKALSILVADDHEEIRKLMRIWLEGYGHAVACASTGNEAARLFEAHPFDLVITDVLMPDGNGLELCERLRRANPRPQILAISGGNPNFASATCLQFARHVGANGLLLKPFTGDQLMRAIQVTMLDKGGGPAPDAPPLGKPPKLGNFGEAIALGT
jgi:CheY-like chemotaxis protein